MTLSPEIPEERPALQSWSERDAAALTILAAAIGGLAAKVNAPSLDLTRNPDVATFKAWVLDVLARVNEQLARRSPSSESPPQYFACYAVGVRPTTGRAEPTPRTSPKSSAVPTLPVLLESPRNE